MSPDKIKSEVKEETSFNTALIILAVFFCVGIIGLSLASSRTFFIRLTPVALLLSLVTVFIFHRPGNLWKEITVFIVIFLAGFAIEALGVKTGRIFGRYTYGNGLWIKFLNTPVLIGINWALLVYCSTVISDRFLVPVFFRILISALLMVIYDLIMEQIAPEMDMWHFENGSVPALNYISWFLLALIFNSVVRLSGTRLENRIAPFVFFIQGAFFLILTILFKLIK